MSITKLNNLSLSAVTALPAGVGGKVLQVLSTTKTDTFSTTSGTYVDVTGLSVSITPSSASNKILVLSSIVYGQETINSGGHFTINRGATILKEYNINYQGDTLSARYTTSFNFLDSPNSTSSLTYKLQMKTDGGYTNAINRSNSGATDNGDSTITVIEIAG